MLKSPKKTFVGHGVWCYNDEFMSYFQKNCKWGRMRSIQRNNMYDFYGVRIKSSRNKIQCVILLYDCKVTLLSYVITLLCLSKAYIWLYFVSLKWNASSILVSSRHNMWSLCYDHVEDLDNVCATN